MGLLCGVASMVLHAISRLMPQFMASFLASVFYFLVPLVVKLIWVTLSSSMPTVEHIASTKWKSGISGCCMLLRAATTHVGLLVSTGSFLAFCHLPTSCPPDPGSKLNLGSIRVILPRVLCDAHQAYPHNLPWLVSLLGSKTLLPARSVVSIMVHHPSVSNHEWIRHDGHLLPSEP